VIKFSQELPLTEKGFLALDAQIFILKMNQSSLALVFFYHKGFAAHQEPSWFGSYSE